MKSTYYPWPELINAFIDNIPRRLELMEASAPCWNPVQELAEFRTLVISGPRQCGKTEAVIQGILSRDKVKLSTHPTSVPYFKSKLGEERFNQFFMSGDLLGQYAGFHKGVGGTNPFEGIKFMVFDDSEDDAFECFKTIFQTHRDWFDPEFMVILAL